MIFGAHMSTAGGVYRALERGHSIGCRAVQIFVKSNMRWYGTPFPAQDLAAYASTLSACRFACVFGHTGYLINLGAPSSPNRDHSIKSLIQEIELATALELPFLVLHPGAHLGKGEPAALKQIVSGLDEVIAATPRSRVRIALENTAGQGTCLGHRVEHLAAIYEAVRTPARLGICVDTAHLFAAGYDIRTPKGWNQVIAQVDSLLGCKQILAFHLNDSKTPLGSRVDRHAHIGEGHIGRNGFRAIVRDVRFASIPGCLETPKSESLKEDVANLAVLRLLAGKKVRA